jgi:nitroreductase
MEKAEYLLGIVKGRRSIRRFKPNPVQKEHLNFIFEAARWAPSAGNRQSWRFIVVTESEMRQKIGEIYQTIRESELKLLPPDSPHYKATAERVKAEFYKNMFAGAPINIVVCGVPKESFRMRTYVQDCAVTTQNLLLMAHALGLGSVYINFDRPEHEDLVKQIQKLLEVPEDVKIMAILPLGYPDEQPTVPPRKELDEIVFHEKYGQKARRELR